MLCYKENQYPESPLVSATYGPRVGLLITDLCHRSFFFGDAVALLRESYAFV